VLTRGAADLVDDGGRLRHRLNDTYVQAVLRAGGTPLILPCVAGERARMLEAVDGVVMTGGDDIDTRALGIPLHPAAECMLPERQESEFATLRWLDEHPNVPVLGICLGMQLMGVHRGCRLIQHLHDEIADGERHRHDRIHAVESLLGNGPVASWHHQALGDAGPFELIGRSDDGVIEAIRDPGRPFYVGVQWHPERTPDRLMGDGIVQRLVEASR
ncbi:MAG: gamma-glutamyl-gamma-aminobutyrate hydrolase family protein, partial [Phycisphaerales bacterium]